MQCVHHEASRDCANQIFEDVKSKSVFFLSQHRLWLEFAVASMRSWNRPATDRRGDVLAVGDGGSVVSMSGQKIHQRHRLPAGDAKDSIGIFCSSRCPSR